ncbi:MAG: helix-turn-helix domain-containing protein [Bacteroidota bacterium]
MSAVDTPPRDFSAMKARRLRAAEWFSAGEMTQAAIARELQTSRQSVSRWYRQWQRGGARTLEGAGRAGRKPRLNEGQRRRLAAALRKGARAYGFGSDRWTLDRVSALIEELTGVIYHRGHVWRILRGMGWTLQRGR